MKSITQAARDLLAALDAYEDDVNERDAADYTEETADRIYTAKAALRKVIADPTPMPAPALYDAIVPGSTVVEWEYPHTDRVAVRRAVVKCTERIDGGVVLWPDGDSALYIPTPPSHTHRAVQLLTSTGEVLWRRP